MNLMLRRVNTVGATKDALMERSNLVMHQVVHEFRDTMEGPCGEPIPMQGVLPLV
jgi:hypothetical protein